jgi:O-antigen/teichoic acid export membrane protein
MNAFVSRYARSETVRHASIVFLATAFVNAANFAFHFGSVRLLGIADYGALAAILAMMLIVSVPATVLQAVIATTIAELSAQRDVPALLHFGSRILRVAIVPAAIVIVVGFALAHLVSLYLSLDDPILVDLASVWFGIFVVVAILRGVLQGAQLFGSLAVSLGLEAGGNLLLGLGFVALHGGIKGALFGNVLAIVLALAYSAFRISGTASTERFLLDVRRLLEKVAGTAGALLALAAMAWCDVLLVRHFATPELAGLYGALSIVGKVLLFSISFLPTILLPKISRIGSGGANARSMLLRMLAAGAGICALQLFVLVMFPSIVLAIVAGAASVPAGAYLPAYGAAISALALTTIIANYNVGLHRFGFVVPLALVELGEIVAIYHYHATLRNIVTVVLSGHTFALVLVALATLIAERPFLIALTNVPAGRARGG